jgi:SAM-dependent methyltransferase
MINKPYVHSDQDRERWNKKYTDLIVPEFKVNSLLRSVLQYPLMPGVVLDLACGASGNALAMARRGYDVIAVDISEVGLRLLESEVNAQGLASKVTIVCADLNKWRPPQGSFFSLVIASAYWSDVVFEYALAAVAVNSYIAWEGFSELHLKYRPDFPINRYMKQGEPKSLLSNDFSVLHDVDLDNGSRATRQLIAKRLR